MKREKANESDEKGTFAAFFPFHLLSSFSLSDSLLPSLLLYYYGRRFNGYGLAHAGLCSELVCLSSECAQQHQRRGPCCCSCRSSASSINDDLIVIVIIISFIPSLRALLLSAVRRRALDGATGEGRGRQRVPLAGAGAEKQSWFSKRPDRSFSSSYLSFSLLLILDLDLNLSLLPALSKPSPPPSTTTTRSARAASSPSPPRRRASSSSPRAGCSSTFALPRRSPGPP